MIKNSLWSIINNNRVNAHNTIRNTIIKSSPVLYSTSTVQKETKSNVVFEVTSSNFQDNVLGSSTLVLLDCYADWCPPCR